SIVIIQLYWPPGQVYRFYPRNNLPDGHLFFPTAVSTLRESFSHGTVFISHISFTKLLQFFFIFPAKKAVLSRPVSFYPYTHPEAFRGIFHISFRFLP
ncbi:MAG: hypothetical protein DRH32_07545, partial [Deltaproteobacteria bacterium]